MKKIVLIVSLFTLYICGKADAQTTLRGATKEVTRVVNEFVNERLALTKPVKVISISTKAKNSTVVISLSEQASYMPVQQDDIDELENRIRSVLPRDYAKKKIEIYSDKKKLEGWISILDGKKRNRGNAPEAEEEKAWVRNTSRPYVIKEGMAGRHLAVWGSHGLYFNQAEGDWIFQRPSLFGTAEDVFTSSFVIPLLAPMLENAGAVVFMPRERDYNPTEIIVDNDGADASSFVMTGKANSALTRPGGFGFFGNRLSKNQNPFVMGSHVAMQAMTSADAKAAIRWQPKFEHKAEYAVYVSYQPNEHAVTDAHYTVRHMGGETNFWVNQRIGAGTWVYLGTFLFDKGQCERGAVVLTNESKHAKGVITADAVKFGGGMGSVERCGEKTHGCEAPQVSGYARAYEGARYWLQWAGMPDSVYSSTKGEDDYKDDIISRPSWVNYLSGGSRMNPKQSGLKVPIDLSLAFHSDAGTTKIDSIVGTLGIYSLREGKFESGLSTMLSRDLTEAVQTEIVNDIRSVHEPKWMARGMWNKRYAEARIQEVPATLLELLSHQNLYDMHWGLNPEFRFTVARAVYKGILKYLSASNNVPYVVQPLPVKAVRSELLDNGGVAIKWLPTRDSLESTADAKRYVVYKRINYGGWDNGRVVNEPNVVISDIVNDSIYSFKVTALNDGGESFPSEVVAVCRRSNSKGKVLVVNGFTRLDAPSYFSNDTLQGGLVMRRESGVGRGTEHWFTGHTREFSKEVAFRNNDDAGFGSSHLDYVGKGIKGNTFDFSILHGEAFRALGYSFASVSEEALMDVAVNDYSIIDLYYGKQKANEKGQFKVFSARTLVQLNEYLKGGGRLLVSGAMVMQEVVKQGGQTEKFFTDKLKTSLRCSYATASGEIRGRQGGFTLQRSLSLPMQLDASPYALENVDGLTALGSAKRVLNYADGNKGAAVAYRNGYASCVLAFPFEALEDVDSRIDLLKEILRFWEK